MNALSSRSEIATARRVVVKIGSSSLTGADGHLDLAALRALVDVLAARRAAGGQVVLVTSGAIAAGLGPLGLPSRPRDLATAQATASFSLTTGTTPRSSSRSSERCALR